MKSYPINKGIGRQIEFKGLTAQYVFLFAGGLLAAVLLTMVLFFAGVSQWFCLVIGISLASGVVYTTYTMNRKYGPHGLMKRMARSRIPRRILCRRRIYKTLKRTSYEK